MNGKKAIGNLLKIGIPLGLGVFLIWYRFHDISDEDLNKMKNAFANTNYWWLVLSSFIGVLSHMSRAYRWSFTLKPLGYVPKFWNSFYCVMIGYLANLLVPRMGEVSRCGYMVKVSDMKFDKLFGTVIGERVADLILLLTSLTAVFFIQSEFILESLSKNGMLNLIIDNPLVVGAVAIVGLIVGLLLLRMLAKAEEGFLFKLRNFLVGIKEGVLTILTMEDKWAFIFHTLLIWGLYVLMFYVTIFSLEEVSNVPFTGVLSAFVMGGLSVAATNGGLGAYPIAIGAILYLYGVETSVGEAYGWVIWIAQTVMIITVGLLSVLLIELTNKEPLPANAD